jgi:serine/threonine-protein kinase
MVGEYEVTGEIGAGGMGAVFAAIHPRIGKRVAIKVLQRFTAADPTMQLRFENEARAVNAIGHPNIVDIFLFGELADGSPYFVMEHVEGEPLSAWLERHGALSLDRALPILRPILEALAAAHDRGIVHRDLKPGNIMIAGAATAPRIKVLDFGLAKVIDRMSAHPATLAAAAVAAAARHDLLDGQELTNPGVAMGTPYFMSPEQHLGEPVDHRTDIYALGVIVYQMLCGCYPFGGTTPTEIKIHHITEHPAPPSSIVRRLGPHIDAVVLKALAKNPADRFASVRELQEALDACVAATAVMPVPSITGAAAAGTTHSTSAAAAMSAPPAMSLPRRRMWMVAGVAGAVVAAILAMLIVRSLRADRPTTTAAPESAATATGAPATGAPATGAPATGAPATGVPSRGEVVIAAPPDDSSSSPSNPPSSNSPSSTSTSPSRSNTSSAVVPSSTTKRSTSSKKRTSTPPADERAKPTAKSTAKPPSPERDDDRMLLDSDSWEKKPK